MVLFSVYLNYQIKRKHKKSKEPFSEKRLRSAGESAFEFSRLEFEELLYRLFGITIANFAGFVAVWSRESISLQFVLLVWIVTSLVTLWFGRKLTEHWRTSQGYKLGAEGERVVGEQLMRDLLPKGFMVYHDLILDPNYESKKFNIDHIVVGPTGVFAIETKTRSKQREEGRTAVKRDSDQIRFGGFIDSNAIPQAQRASNELKKFLGPCLPGRNRVDWAIAVPGWWTQGVPQTDQVMNHKMLARFICERRGNELSANDISIISQMIAEKNRIEPVKRDPDRS